MSPISWTHRSRKFSNFKDSNGNSRYFLLIPHVCCCCRCTLSLYNAFMWTVGVKAGQSELNGAEHTSACTHTRTLYHHVAFLNWYIDVFSCNTNLSLGTAVFAFVCFYWEQHYSLQLPHLVFVLLTLHLGNHSSCFAIRLIRGNAPPITHKQVGSYHISCIYSTINSSIDGCFHKVDSAEILTRVVFMLNLKTKGNSIK